VYTDLSVLHRGSTTLVASSGSLLLAWAMGPPSVGDLEALQNHARALASRFPSGIGFLLCLSEDARPPPADQRDAVVKCLKTLGPSLRALGCAVPGQGFAAAAKRGALSLVLMAAKLPTVSKTFGDIRQALSWTFDHLEGSDGVRFDRAPLIQAATELVRPAAA